MLVLSRRAGDKVKIGKDIVVSVEQIGRGKVSLGFVAPRGVSITREEVGEPVECVSASPDGAVYSCGALDCPVHGERNKLMRKG